MLVGGRRGDVNPSSSLYGRETECATLDGLLNRVRGGHSAVLVLRGEAGIGKTALLRYVADRAAGFNVVRCMGVESEMELAFAGLHDLCTPILSCLEGLIEPQREALSVALGLTSGERPDPFMVALAALNLLALASEDRPLLCVVDDVQWLDRATAQALGFVGRRLLAEPVGLVFATRTPGRFMAAPEDPLAGLPDLRLAGLDEQTARKLLASVRAARLDESVGYSIARLFASAAVGAVVAGWGIGQYPWMLVDQLTISDAAGARSTLTALLVVVALAVVIVLPALAYLLCLTQSEMWSRAKVHPEVHAESDVGGSH